VEERSWLMNERQKARSLHQTPTCQCNIRSPALRLLTVDKQWHKCIGDLAGPLPMQFHQGLGGMHYP